MQFVQFDLVSDSSMGYPVLAFRT